MPTASTRTNPRWDTPPCGGQSDPESHTLTMAPILAAAPDETAPQASQSDLAFEHPSHVLEQVLERKV